MHIPDGHRSSLSLSLSVCVCIEKEIFREKFNFSQLFVPVEFPCGDGQFPLLPTNIVMSPSKVIPYIIGELINSTLWWMEWNGTVHSKQNKIIERERCQGIMMQISGKKYFFYTINEHLYYHFPEIIELIWMWEKRSWQQSKKKSTWIQINFSAYLPVFFPWISFNFCWTFFLFKF